MERREGGREALEIAVTRRAQRSPVGRGVLVRDVRSHGGVNGHGDARRGRGEQHGDFGGGEARPAFQVLRQRLPHAAPGPRSLGDGGIHLAPGLLRHAERAVRQATGDVLARAAERGELEVVDRGTAVHREMRDHAAPHQLPQQRAEADLDDVTPEQHDDRSASRRARNLVGDVAQVLRGEDVGERAPKGGEALVAAGRVAEEGGVDFVGAPGDGDGLEARKIRLTVLGHGCPAGGGGRSTP